MDFSTALATEAASTRWKPHVTVAAVIERQGQFLLVEEHTPSGLRLNNPAGHLEPEESLVQACIREVQEETAHVFQPTHLVGVYLFPSSRATVVATSPLGETAGDTAALPATRTLATAPATTPKTSPVLSNHLNNNPALATAAASSTYLRFAFAGELGAALASQALDEGIVRALWLSYEELYQQAHRLRTPPVLQCIEDYRKGQRFDLALLHTQLKS